MKKYLAAFFAGAATVLAAIVIYLLKNVKPIINADQYVAEMEQKVGKIKQRGEGNAQNTNFEQAASKKEARQERKETRKETRQRRREHKSESKKPGD